MNVVVQSIDEAKSTEIEYPCEVRAAFTLRPCYGIAFDRLAMIGLVTEGLIASATAEVLLSWPPKILVMADELKKAASSYAGDCGLHEDAYLWDKIRAYDLASSD